MTSTVVLRGRRGTNSHLLSFCVAGVALMVLGGALGHGLGRRDARGSASLPSVAGVAQTHIYRRFAWQAWQTYGRFWVLYAALGPVVLGGLFWSPVAPTSSSRRGSSWHVYHYITTVRFVSLCVAKMRGTYGTGWHLWARFRRA